MFKHTISLPTPLVDEFLKRDMIAHNMNVKLPSLAQVMGAVVQEIIADEKQVQDKHVAGYLSDGSKAFGSAFELKEKEGFDYYAWSVRKNHPELPKNVQTAKGNKNLLLQNYRGIEKCAVSQMLESIAGMLSSGDSSADRIYAHRYAFAMLYEAKDYNPVLIAAAMNEGAIPGYAKVAGAIQTPQAARVQMLRVMGIGAVPFSAELYKKTQADKAPGKQITAKDGTRILYGNETCQVEIDASHADIKQMEARILYNETYLPVKENDTLVWQSRAKEMMNAVALGAQKAAVEHVAGMDAVTLGDFMKLQYNIEKNVSVVEQKEETGGITYQILPPKDIAECNAELAQALEVDVEKIKYDLQKEFGENGQALCAALSEMPNAPCFFQMAYKVNFPTNKRNEYSEHAIRENALRFDEMLNGENAPQDIDTLIVAANKAEKKLIDSQLDDIVFTEGDAEDRYEMGRLLTRSALLVENKGALAKHLGMLELPLLITVGNACYNTGWTRDNIKDLVMA